MISPDLDNTTSQFYTAQCGNYNAQTNPSGFISGANLQANAIRHEGGSVQSHYQNYQSAQDNPSNNIGVGAESIIGGPSLAQADFDLRVRNSLNARLTAIKNAAAVEPCGPTYNANCQFQGYVNYMPYQPCP